MTQAKLTPAKSKYAPLIGLAVLVVFGLIIFFWAKNTNNNMVQLNESVQTAWSQVENQYQRRASLIPNLVNTVSGYAEHERETLDAVTSARARVSSLSVNPDDFQNSLPAYEAAQNQLGGALSRLLVVSERYPELKANQLFENLQIQLEGTENRIAVERMRFNEAVQAYNTTVRSFPNSLVANLFGFAPIPYFKAESGAETAPVVDFSGR